MSKWLHAIRQPSTYLGVAVIAIIWGGIFLLANDQHSRAAADSLRQGDNLARGLQEYITRIVQASDRALLALGDELLLQGERGSVIDPAEFPDTTATH